jgi:uncharacterized BrkB/YihY/UPF0761 family membrane protein
MKNFIKSIFAVFAGLIFIVATHTIVDQVLQAKNILPKDNLWVSTNLILLVIFYRAILSFFGCFLTAHLAPQKPLKHSLILGGIGTVFSIIGSIANQHYNLGPNWYPWTLVILSLPIAYFAGYLKLKKSKK